MSGGFIAQEYVTMKSMIDRSIPRGIDVQYASPKSNYDVEFQGQKKIGQNFFINWYRKRENEKNNPGRMY